MGRSFLFLALLSASSTSALAQLQSELVLHPKLPLATITKTEGIGTEASMLEANVLRANAIDWCDNWQPGDADCAAEQLASHPAPYMASSNCKTGSMTDPNGAKVTFDGFVDKGDFVGWFAFKDAQTGKRIGTDNASGGLVLANQWMALCPYGLPYDRLPLKSVLDDEAYDLPGEIIAHNRQPMKLIPDLGVIAYIEPKASFIEPHTILFRGSIPSANNPVQGMAFTFKEGCDPAPYWVEGWYDGGLTLELRGKAPIWAKNGCQITGYSEKSPHSKLVFNFEPA